MSKVLENVALNQGLWSKTADNLKNSYETVRATVFALSIIAALLATVSSQLDGRSRLVLALLSTACMTAVSFAAARLLDSSHSQAWVRARAASEALKQHAYRRAALAEPYDNPATADDLLSIEAGKILDDIKDLDTQRAATGSSSAPVGVITAADYVAKRVAGQIKWHEEKAVLARNAAKSWRAFEFVLALLTAIITAVVGALPKDQLGWFDFVALTAVLTTLSGAILAYIEASRYDFIVSTYRATATRLGREQATMPTVAPPAPEWSAFVNRCEAILQEQNNSWVAKFTKTP